jgi:hypothetical protein
MFFDAIIGEGALGNKGKTSPAIRIGGSQSSNGL